MVKNGKKKIHLDAQKFGVLASHYKDAQNLTLNEIRHRIFGASGGNESNVSKIVTGTGGPITFKNAKRYQKALNIPVAEVIALAPEDEQRLWQERFDISATIEKVELFDKLPSQLVDEVAKYYIGQTEDDYETALREMQHAIMHLVQQDSAETGLSNIDASFNVLTSQVKSLNAQGQSEDAAAMMDAEEPRIASGLDQFYRQRMEQSRLMRDFETFARCELKIVENDSGSIVDHFEAAEDRFRAHLMEGLRGSLPFHLEIAISLMGLIKDRYGDEQKRKVRCLDRLGNALYSLGEIRQNANLLKQAAEARQEALRYIDENENPESWGVLQYSLGSGLLALAPLSTDPTILNQAVDALEASLTVRSFNETPVPWANSKTQLGIVLRNLGERTGEPEHFKSSIKALKDAQRVRTKSAAPDDWARTQVAMAASMTRKGEIERCPKTIADAAKRLRSALRICTKSKVPIEYAKINVSLGKALTSLARLEENPNHLKPALQAFTRAKSARSSGQHDEWQRVFDLVEADAHALLGALNDDPQSLMTAAQGYRDFIEAVDEVDAPEDFAHAKKELAAVQSKLAQLQGMLH